MSFTTPPRPLDVTVLFPQLAPLARTATRLHPRPGSPSVHDSSVGGPLLGPADELSIPSQRGDDLCGQSLGEGGSVLAFVVDRALETAHAV